MGFYNLIKKICRMVFRDFLFKIPKKYLVAVIIFLVYILLTNSHVFGATADINNVELHEYADITDYYYNNKIDTLIVPTYNNNLYLKARIDFTSSWVNVLQLGSYFAFYNGQNAGTTKNLNYEINGSLVSSSVPYENDSVATFAFLFQDDNIVSVNGVNYASATGVTMGNTSNHLFIQNNSPRC